MLWWLPTFAATTFPSVPHPSPAIGAVCQATVRFDDGEMTRHTVPRSCPEPFRTAIREHLELHPIELPTPPEQLDVRYSFVVGRKGSVTEPLADTPSPFAHPAPDTRVHLPEESVRFKRQRWPKNPGGLHQPVVCSVDLHFDRKGMVETLTVRGCPPDLALPTQEAALKWRVHPTYLGVDVRVRTTVRVAYGPS